MATLEQRFWMKVNKAGSIPPHRPLLGQCWEWTASKNSGGYGKLAVDARRAAKKFEDAHRVSWRMHFGAIPAGRQVCHACDNRACVRPDHLWLGDNRLNWLDSKAKNRQKQRGTSCPHGHLFTPENTYVNTKNRWVCRTCGRAATKAYEAKQRALLSR